MADQVNPTGGLAPGIPLTASVAPAPKPVARNPRPVSTLDPPVPGQAGVPASPGASEAAADAVNQHLQQTGSELKFQVDRATGRTIFKVVNETTGEVVLQVPSEEVLALARNLRTMDKHAGASGVLVDKEG